MEGGCHCGAIRFKTEEKPIWLGRCHCIDCQKISGTAFMAFAGFHKEKVKFTKGKPKEYKSSENVIRSFCENCGSPIEWRDVKNPDKTNISLGLFDNAKEFEVHKDIFLEQKVPWKKE